MILITLREFSEIRKITEDGIVGVAISISSWLKCCLVRADKCKRVVFSLNKIRCGVIKD